ncbi:hypothetical protein SAMN06265173_104167 [Thalassovita litoralis]|jgi:hypothetical protein|uniref:Uncharacterized protein n=1 Tax=Thalassovita litoralis TaxID=1010611 RepID=A0A521BVJ1_9RHOB|nr:hypothetical protein [Thalassovita litoralis]SMO51189.1 hypothetical protein SAMN06265173_104167 [Thalassovita litoralis]
MQTIQNGTRGLSLLLLLNWDRILVVGALTLAMVAGAYWRTF